MCVRCGSQMRSLALCSASYESTKVRRYRATKLPLRVIRLRTTDWKASHSRPCTKKTWPVFLGSGPTRDVVRTIHVGPNQTAGVDITFGMAESNI